MHDWSFNPALGCHEVTAPMACDGDGANGQSSLPCYAPVGMKSLDLLENAGHPGNWWGILTNSLGHPIKQGPSDPAPCAYISTTSYQFGRYPNGQTIPLYDVNRYLDAAQVKFIIVPKRFQLGVPGEVLGCYCEVEHDGRTVDGIVGDIGPDFGEASMAMCRAFDPIATPRGSNIGTCVYRIWPGRAVPGYPLLKASA